MASDGPAASRSPAQLAFRVFHVYDLAAFRDDVQAIAPTTVATVLVVLLLLIVPGWAFARVLLPVRQFDLPAQLGLAVGASITLSAIVLGAATLIGARLDGTLLAVGLVMLVALAFRRRTPARAATSLAGPVVLPWLVLMMGIWAVALRLIVVRDLEWPLWVDSVHHALVARAIAETGVVPADYGPLVPPQPFNYHFGFHTPAAFAHWWTGAPIPWLVLLVGQLLGGLVVFPLYLLASELWKSRWAGAAAAASVGCLSTLPAYYVSWGRYPQLAGAIVLAAAFVALRLASGDAPARAGKYGWRAAEIFAAALLAGGLVLTHARVALLFGALVAAWLVVETLAALARVEPPNSWLRGLAQRWAVTGAVAGLAGIVAAPWVARLVGSPAGALLGDGLAVEAAPFTPPLFHHTDELLATLALVGALVGIGRAPLVAGTIVLWLIFVWLLANPSALRLPVFFFLSHHSVEIALFLPIALLVGGLVAASGDLLARARVPGLTTAAALVALVVVLGASGRLLGVVNPGTVLHTRDDAAAIAWAATHLPADAVVLINAFRWQADIYTGTDGGYWLLPLAHRQTTTPPIVYHSARADAREHVQRSSAAIATWDGNPATLRQLIAEHGITHIYVGARHGSLRPTVLEAQGYPILYNAGRARIYRAVLAPRAAVGAQ